MLSANPSRGSQISLIIGVTLLLYFLLGLQSSVFILTTRKNVSGVSLSPQTP